jgi:hypothetical protein
MGYEKESINKDFFVISYYLFRMSLYLLILLPNLITDLGSLGKKLKYIPDYVPFKVSVIIFNQSSQNS